MFTRPSVRKSFGWTTLCALALAFAGCDTHQRIADNAAWEQMKKVDTQWAGAAGEDELKGVADQYDSLAGSVSTLSPRMQVLIKGNEAEVHFELATLQLADLRTKELGITRTIDEIENLAVQVAASQTTMASLQAYDPSKQIDDIHAKEATIQGSVGDGTTGTSSSLASLGAQIDKLNDQINQGNAQKQSLDKSRVQALQQADDLTRKSEGETGDDQLKDVIAASNVRRGAGDTDAQIDGVSAQIARWQTDLDALTAQKSALDAAVASLESQVQALQTGWSSIQQQMDAQKTLQQQIIGADSSASDSDSGAVTIALLASRLSTMLSDAGTLRDSLNTQLQQAIDQYTDASSAAEELRGQLLPKVSGMTPSPDAPIYQETMNTLNPGYYNLQKAAAMQDQAGVAASNAVIQNMLGQMFDGYQVASGSGTAMVPGLKTLLDRDKTGMDIPQSVAGLPHPDPDSVKQLKQDSDDKFKAALDAYNDRPGTDTGQIATDQTNLALLGRVATNRKWAQYATLLGDSDGASQHLRDADSDDSQIDPAFRTAGQPAPKAPAANGNSPGAAGASQSDQSQ